MNIQLNTSYSVGLIILGFVISVAFAVWSYRWTIPPVSNNLKVILIFARSIALISGIWLLAQPNLIVERKKEEPPKIAILLDYSQSMNLRQNEFDRLKSVKDAFNSSAYEDFKENCEVMLFGFGDTVIDLTNNEKILKNFEPNLPATDIGMALTYIAMISKKIQFQSAFLISDGIVNRGAEPVRIAKSLNFPIWTVGVGTVQPSMDAMIISTNVNPIVYQGTRTTITVGYRVIGLKDRTLNLLLRDRTEKVVNQTQIKPTSDFEEGEAKFEVDITEAGKLRWTAEISNLEGELTYDNNRHSFYMNALTDKIKVLFISGGLSNTCGDLIRRLSSDEHIKLTTRIARGKSFFEGGWLEEDEISKIDVIFIHQFPTQQTDRSALNGWTANVIKYRIPLCFIDGDLSTPNASPEIIELLPISYTNHPVRLSSGQLLPAQRHAIISTPDDLNYENKWRELPPLQFALDYWTLKPGAEVLAYFQMINNQRVPGLIIQQVSGYKSAAILARDLWRWGLASPGEEGILEPLLGRLIRWLALKPMEKRIIIQFYKDQYGCRENVVFYVSVYNENFLPINDAEVDCEVNLRDKDQIKFTLEPNNSGQYRGSFTSWGEGEYTVKVNVKHKGEFLGSDSAKVMVEPFSIELLDTRLNEELLRKIGELTGGGYITIDKLDSLFSVIKFPN